MTDRPRALFVASFPPPVTGQTVATQAFWNMAARAFEVDRLDFSDPGRHERPSGSFSLSQLGKVVRVARAILRGPRYDLGYLTVASSAMGRLRDVVLLSALARRASRIVVHVHQGSFGRSTQGAAGVLTRFVMKRRVDGYLFLAPALAEEATWVPRDRVSIVPNPPGEGVRMEADDVEEAIRQRGDADVIRVLFLANMLPGKGHDRLLESLPQVREGLPGGKRLVVDFAGAWPSPQSRDAFEGRARSLKLGSIVRVHGPVQDRARVLGLLSRAHALVFPSTYATEGAPLSVIEALGTGTPVVAMRHAALPDLVEDGRSGVLLPPTASPSELAQAVLLTVAEARWEDLARTARRLFEERFSEIVVERAFLGALSQ